MVIADKELNVNVDSIAPQTMNQWQEYVYLNFELVWGIFSAS